jgi:uncharacterized membrane protein YidH (DUF202 family)
MLWGGLLIAPVAFLANLEIAYALVSTACGSRTTLPLHLVNAASLVLALVGGLMAWRTWNEVGRAWPDGEPGPIGRSRFLASVGLMLTGICVLVILAQWTAVFLLDPCQ